MPTIRTMIMPKSSLYNEVKVGFQREVVVSAVSLVRMRAEERAH